MQKPIYFGATLAVVALCGSANAATLVFNCGAEELVNTSAVDTCPGISAPAGDVVTAVVLSYAMRAVSPNGPDGQLAPATLDFAAPAGFSSPSTSYEFTGSGVDVITVPDGPAEEGLSAAGFDTFNVSITRAPEANPSANTFASVSVTYTLAPGAPPSTAPEPMMWTLMLFGFSLAGVAVRAQPWNALNETV